MWEWISEIIKAISLVIAEAAKSRLGIVALVIVVLTLLAWQFFGNDPTAVKLLVYCMIVAVCLFVVAIVMAGSQGRRSRQRQ